MFWQSACQTRCQLTSKCHNAPKSHDAHNDGTTPRIGCDDCVKVAMAAERVSHTCAERRRSSSGSGRNAGRQVRRRVSTALNKTIACLFNCDSTIVGQVFNLPATEVLAAGQDEILPHKLILAELPAQIRFQKFVDPAVEHRLRIPDPHTRASVLHELIWVEHIMPHRLATEADL